MRKSECGSGNREEVGILKSEVGIEKKLENGIWKTGMTSE